MPDVYLTPRRGRLWDERRACPVCIANDPRPHRGLTYYQGGDERRPRGWFNRARAYVHPNPFRANVTIWRCRRHARLRFVPVDEKQGLRGAVYR